VQAARYKYADVLIFAETTTFGARTYRAQRRTLPREFVSVATNYGEVRIKICPA